jgi:hypothetical protein
MADVATLGLKVDATGALQGIGAVETKLQKLEASANQAGALIGKAFLAGGAAMAGLGALVLKNTADAERAFAQLEAGVKSTGGVAGFTAQELRKIAGELQDISTYGDEAIQDMQSLLLTFTNVRGDNFTEASKAILDMSTRMGGDLKSAAVQVGKALQDPILGVTALTKVGVKLTDSQKATIEQMMKLGDVAGAQKVILNELKTEFDGSALAARNTMGGALTALRNAFGDLLEVPSIIAPITVSLNAMVDVLKNPAAVQGVKTFVQDTVFLLGSLAQAFLELTAVAIDTVGGLARLFGKLSPASSPLNKAADAADKWSASLVNTAYAIDDIQNRIAEFTPSVSKAGKALSTYAASTEELDEKAIKAAASLRELRGELEVRSARALGNKDGAAALENLIKQQKEYTSAVEKGASVELRLLVALTQAREEYRDALDLANNTALKQLPIITNKVAEASLPPEKALSAWQDFLGYIRTELGFTTESIAGTFAQTFSNIAARGKATFADLFSTIGGLFGKKADGTQSTGAAIFGPLAVGASIVGGIIGNAKAERQAAIDALNADMEAFNDALSSFTDSFRIRGSVFAEELKRIADFMADAVEDANDVLTITARRALNRAGGNVDQAIADRTRVVESRFGNPADDVAIKQLQEYKRQMEAATKATAEATEAARKANEQRNKEMQSDLEIRRLSAMGLDSEAKALRDQLERQRELNEAEKNGADEATLAMMRLVHGLEAAADAADALAEAEKEIQELRWTLGGLDAAIARESGDSDLAEQLERDIERQRILAEVTDETIKAKYEELWAIQDTNRAAREAAEAIQLLANQAQISEDLEVRKLMATGKTMEAEELRFQLEQKRELARAEADFAAGLITQDILDQLREVLGLEAGAFATRNQQAGESPTFGGSANPLTRSGGTQTLGSFAGAQVQDIDRVVGELSTIRVRSGQVVSLLTQLVRGGGILGAVNTGIQSQTNTQGLVNGNLVVS